MNYTQNHKIAQVTESTLVVGVDIGSERHYARAFDWRGLELTRKAFPFSNSLEGYQRFEQWVTELQDTKEKDVVLVGCEPTGHYWFTFGDYVQSKGMKLVTIPISDGPVERWFSLVIHKDKYVGPPLRAFLELCKEYKEHK